MFRMILLTLAALYGVLAYYGTPEMNPSIAEEPRQAAALAAGRPSAPSKPVMIAPVPPEVTLAAVAQTAPSAPRFPGPPLVPSPEHAAGDQAPLATAPAEGLVVSGDSVNMRAGPGPDRQRVGSLMRGAIVTPVGPTTGAWVEVRDASGLQGFVSARYLSPNRPG